MVASRRAIPHMIAQGGGSIINIASMAGLSGASAGVAYTVSKHALIGLTRSTPWMYAPNSIRYNAICPGGTRTNIGETMDPAKTDAVGRRAQAHSTRSFLRSSIQKISPTWRCFWPQMNRVTSTARLSRPMPADAQPSGVSRSSI